MKIKSSLEANKQTCKHNEVIRAVLNSLFYFFFFTKRFRMLKKHQKGQKAQKRNQAKAQNANKQTKIKNALKNI